MFTELGTDGTAVHPQGPPTPVQSGGSLSPWLHTMHRQLQIAPARFFKNPAYPDLFGLIRLLNWRFMLQHESSGVGSAHASVEAHGTDRALASVDIASFSGFRRGSRMGAIYPFFYSSRTYL